MRHLTLEPARPLDTDGMPWIPTGPGKSFRPLRFAADGWSELMRLEPGSTVAVHRHTGEVHAFNLAGTREIFGTGERVGPGNYVYEPAGTVDGWGAVGDGPSVVHIEVAGVIEYLGGDGQVTQTVSAATQREVYLAWCREHGVRRPSRFLADQARPAHARRAGLLFPLLTQTERRPVTSSFRTMRAMRASGPDPASLACETIPVPEPGPGELLVEVQATAVTAGELTWPESWPAIPCHDLSGVVAAAGPGVEGWATGNEVYGLVGFDRPGAAAEYVTAPAAELAPKPSSIDHLAAAAVPLGALTAWQALHDHARLQPGQYVLVHGGAGGVGAYAVQFAALAGARVTATASARNHAFVTGLGG